MPRRPQNLSFHSTSGIETEPVFPILNRDLDMRTSLFGVWLTLAVTHAVHLSCHSDSCPTWSLTGPALPPGKTIPCKVPSTVHEALSAVEVSTAWVVQCCFTPIYPLAHIRHVRWLKPPIALLSCCPLTVRMLMSAVDAWRTAVSFQRGRVLVDRKGRLDLRPAVRYPANCCSQRHFQVHQCFSSVLGRPHAPLSPPLLLLLWWCGLHTLLAVPCLISRVDPGAQAVSKSFCTLGC